MEQNKSVTAKDLLFKMVGGEDKAREIWEEVKENNRKLNSCPLHDFSIDLKPDRKLGKDWQCTQCGGNISSIDKSWYEKGLEHQRNKGITEDDAIKVLQDAGWGGHMLRHPN